jgi:hypothetical protein
MDLVSPRGDLASIPDSLIWRALTGAQGYKVTVMEVDKNVLWQGTIKDNHISLPAVVRKQILPGKRLLWSVEAYSSAGQVLASASADFRREVIREK